jgi:hypothetical protein
MALERSKCNKEIGAALQNGTMSPNDPIFYRMNGVAKSDPSDIWLTIGGCEATCGKKFDWYPDIGPRLTIWLIPVIILIGNIQFATLGKPTSLLAILHVLGDPIDSAWSLLTKLEASNRCWDLAAKLSSTGDPNHIRDRATILAAIHELIDIDESPDKYYLQLVNVDGLNTEGKDVLHLLLRRIADELSDSTQNQMSRTWLAILGFVHTVVSAFIDAVGGTTSSQPGGRIGIAMFFSWLLTLALLSNITPTFTSRRTCLRALERFARESHRIQNDEAYKASDTLKSPPMSANASVRLDAPDLIVTAPLRRSIEVRDLRMFSQPKVSYAWLIEPTYSTFHDSQAWSGSIYTYYANKELFHVVPRKNLDSDRWRKKEASKWTLLVLAILPLVVAESFSFLIIWFTPTFGLTCRHFPMLGVFIVWFISPFITHIMYTSKFARGKWHWRFTLIKDALIAVPALAIILLTSCGFYNSCVCWSSYFSRGRANGVVMLDPNNTRRHNAETIYPGLVGACLGLQLILFMLIMRLTKRGRALLRRDEVDKTKDFWDLHLAGDETVAHDLYHPQAPRPRKGSAQSMSPRPSRDRSGSTQSISLESYNPRAPLLSASP